MAKKKKVKVWRTFYRFLWPYRGRLLLFYLVVVLAAVATNLAPYFYKLFVDALSRGRNFDVLLKILFTFVAFRLLAALLDSLTYFLGDRVIIPAARDARTSIFHRVQDLDFAYHSQKNTGSLISAFKRGDGAFFEFFHVLNINLVRIFISFLVMFFFFSRLGGWLAGSIFIILLFNIFLIWRLVKINMKRRREFNEAEDEISAIITDNLLNFDTVKYFAKERWERRRLSSSFVSWVEKIWRFSNSFRFLDILVSLVANAGIFFILFLSLKKYVSGQISSGDVVLILGFIVGFFGRFFDLFFNLRTIIKRHVDLRRYFSPLWEEVAVLDPQEPIQIKKIKGEIKFDNVYFSYPGGKEGALRDFSLKIKPGESVALVGSSGAGKTTVAKLLMRFYDVNRGKILIDGYDIRSFRKEDLRSFIGLVPQEAILFNETIAYNIAYGAKRKVSQKEIVAAAKIANLDKFIESLPEKYETTVGERGVRLSGGQRQRLAIARVALARPQIIIFDEATSQLDSGSEKLIQEAFWKISQGRTTIIIAHRLSTVKKADRIVVIDEGRLKEEGSHENLLKIKDGFYRRFWRLQTEGIV